MRIGRLGWVLAGITICALAMAEVASDLQSRLDPLGSLSGAFEQVVRSPEGDILEQSRGQIKLLRPAYFLWHIESPEEQLLVAADGYLWHYDVELETATRRRLADDSPVNPLSILGESAANLEQDYRIERLGDDGWRLIPRFDSADFSAVDLYFEGDLPRQMVVRDPLRRETAITFFGLVRDAMLAPADFSFSPPPGIDVYDDDG